MSTEYTPPIQLDSGRVEIDTTPDSDGDIELIATLEDMHVAYLRPADQIALRDLLNRLHPTEPRTITTVEELDALAAGAVVLSEGYFEDWPTAFQRWGDGLWYRGGRSRDTHPDYFLPAAVVHEGGAA